MSNLKDLGFIESGRFRIIEVFALWEGRANTTHLQNILKISRQTASDIIRQYQKRHPSNLEYNASLKGYVPTAEFTSHYSLGNIDEYNQTLLHSQHPEYVSIVETGFTHLDAPLRKISPALVQPIIRAIRDKLRLDIGYTPISNPEYESRIIEMDYQMENGQRIIPVRAALLMYLTQKLRLDHYQTTPEAQQIIINPECLKKIASYLP